MEFEWDEVKSNANLEKHNLSFEDIHLIFAGDTITITDLRRPYGENRMITYGSLVGRIVVVVHVPRGGKTRIISMRKANAREQRLYQKQLNQT
jgi:uncharacterized DUF497 family protein